MTDPDRSEWQTVWLGKDGTTPPEKGWYPVEGEVRTTRLATFERKVTIGDATRDSDDFISSYVIGDFSGGGQILDINEGSDTDRFWWGVADTRFQNQTSLPPEVVANTLTGTAGTGSNAIARPLGDVPNINGTSTVFHVHYNDKAHGMTSSGFTSGAVLGTNAPVPTHVGVPFWGPSTSTGTTISGPVLVIPSGFGAYYLFSTTDGGSLTRIWCNIETTQNVVSLLYICVFNDILYGVDAGNYLWTSANARVWNKVYSTGTTQLRIPKGQLCRKLTSHMIGVEPKLLAVTDEQVWMLSTVAGGSDLMWVDTPIHYPTSPSNGLGVTRWRQGEDLWINVGPDLLRLTTSNVIVPNNGPIRDDGLPADMYEQGSSYAQATTITSLVGDHNFLYALLVHNNGSKYPDLSVMAWTGTGWHCLWQGGAANISGAYGPENFWMALSRGPQSNLHQDYYLMIGTAEQKVYSMKLRTTFHNVKAGARAGIDRYSTTTALVGSTSGTQNPWVETGRFDANMVGFKKLASHIQIGLEYADTNNGIKLYYQTDASVPATVSTADYSIGWTQIPADKSLINKVGLTTIELPGEAGFNKGIPFQWIRFKVEFVGNSATKTPILNHLVLSYTKVPQDAASFILTIPLPRETFMGRTGQEMADDLLDLLTTQEYVKLVHQNRTYRVRVAGVSGADSTGDDYAGARTVNLIEISG